MAQDAKSMYARTLIFLSVVLFVSASAAIAQDGSAVSPNDPSPTVPAEATTVAPRAEALPTSESAAPSAAAPAPSAGPTPTVSGISDTAQPAVAEPTPSDIATSASAAAESIPVMQNQPSDAPSAFDFPMIAFFALIAVLLFGGCAAYAFTARKRASNENQDKTDKDTSHCLDLKKRMEEKMKELTDIKSQLQNAVTEKVREKVTGALAGTAAAALVSHAEKMEKEYERLRKLYEQCIAGAGSQRRVFIIHNWGGAPDNGWYPWLKRKLEASGYAVDVLSMPDSEEPAIDAWVSHIAQRVGSVDRNTHFIGHSIGCQAILRYLEQLPDERAAGMVVFVAGWFSLKNLETKEENEIARPWLLMPIDYEKAKKHAKNFFAVFSGNDPFVPQSDMKLFEDRLNAETAMLPEMGHFTEDDGVRELPIVLERFSK